ncbi:interleukin-15 receptor subunit alpha isoform X1 [Sturnira hondurensis]|uniref:interleukin-15 receptor subunit alpha isoform X1 n=1 Tax=Sturnira hondurensis TaxID=192404 RepID=UPI0018799A74|nr:interleukin-15 receptor subunit alpha isoform X1 [Sturnira hondurensis]
MVVESKAVTRLLRDCWLSVIPTLLLLLLLLRSPETLGATCSTPTSIEHANIQVKSYNENSRERYICNFGFKRKAGTSSLTKCLRNEDTNITQWTIPSLKCINCYPRQNWGGSGLLPASPASPPQFQGYWQMIRHCCIRDLLWPSLSKVEPAFTFKSDTPTATKPGTTPGSRLMTPKPPSAETTEVTGNEPSQDQSQTTAKALEHTLSASLEKPGAYAYNSTAITVAVSIPVLVICAVCVVFLLARYCKKSRQNSWTPSVQMENMEDRPMTGGTDGSEEDAENHHAA